MSDYPGASVTLSATRDHDTDAAWEYRVVSIHARHNEPLQEALNERGREGWRLVFVHMPLQNEYQCVFCRPASAPM